MFEKPPIPDDEIIAALGASYGIPAASIAFLPLGADSFAAVYRAEAINGARYFLKLRQGALNHASLLVPRFLHDSGVANVAAPLPKHDGSLWVQLGPYTLVVYPFIEGATAMERGMSGEQWAALGATLRQIHALRPTPELAAHLRVERFWSDQIDLVAAVAADLAAGDPADPIRAELAAFWSERAQQIDQIVEHARELSSELRGRELPHVLCHADIHSANVLVASDGQPWIVDWDEVTLAPKERDLMFVTGGGISEYMFPPGSEQHFYAGYGPAALDPIALAYYRCAWARAGHRRVRRASRAAPRLGRGHAARRRSQRSEAIRARRDRGDRNFSGRSRLSRM